MAGGVGLAAKANGLAGSPGLLALPELPRLRELPARLPGLPELPGVPKVHGLLGMLELPKLRSPLKSLEFQAVFCKLLPSQTHHTKLPSSRWRLGLPGLPGLPRLPAWLPGLLGLPGLLRLPKLPQSLVFQSVFCKLLPFQTHYTFSTSPG